MYVFIGEIKTIIFLNLSKVNHGLARYQLQQYKQNQSEYVDNFMTRCRNQATKCKFHNVTETEECLIEQLIIGTKHKKVKERFLKKGEKLKLDIATDIARTWEATISHMERLTGEKQHNVHTI